MTTDWFRNTTWNDSVERAFEDKLRRARSKEQYLRIQASTLARSHPQVALKLLDRYFDLPDFSHAQAYVDRATALLALGRVSDAIAAYEEALICEAALPSFQTQAHLELPYLIATRGVRDQYHRARELLQVYAERLGFPVDHFRWHAARSLMAADCQEPGIARMHAKRALDAAALEHAGFRNHPSVGLVTEQYDDVIRKLERYLAA